jgi:CheY-like chemotaxis protein
MFRVWRAAGRLAGRITSRAAPNGATLRDTGSLDQGSSRFAAYLAHELTNAFAAIISGADVVVSAASEEEARAAASAIAAAGQIGLDLTARIVALTRLDHLTPYPCDIAGTLAAMQQRLERAAGGPDRFRLDLTNRALPASIDRDQFLACMVELVVGARAAAGGREIVVVRTRLMERGGTDAVPVLNVLIEVELSGDDGAVDRAPVASSAPVPAAQFGLAIVDAFARRSGGVLDCVQAGSFSRATLCLPLIRVAAADPAALGRPGAAAGMRAVTRAVVVEDNDFLRGVLARGLRERGMQVGEAHDATEARAMLDGGAAVLITDVVMPGDMDGFSLARWARQRDPSLALLFVSAFMSSRLPEVLASDELASFVRKPIDIDGLLIVLDGLLAVRDEQILRSPGAAATFPHGRAHTG